MWSEKCKHCEQNYTFIRYSSLLLMTEFYARCVILFKISYVNTVAEMYIQMLLEFFVT